MLSRNFISFSLLDQLLLTHSSSLSTTLQYSFTDFILPVNVSEDMYNYIQLLLQNNFTPIQNLTNTFNLSELITFNLQNQSDNVRAPQAIYHYSIPTVKLFYPEPFIAVTSLMYTDIWFVHILLYQYWLWFVFIFIITFLCTVRWCNMRVYSRGETRGVSRSKCGDLITAIVPVSWAASIIISESADAIDYFDGFGIPEMIIGVREYQWGWEYHYPKNIDLNYKINKTNSTFFGKTLKYTRVADSNVSSNQTWKFYQNKPYDFVVALAYLLLIPTDNYKLLNFLNFNDVGTNAFNDLSFFKHTRMYSKIFNSNLLFSTNNFNFKYQTLLPLFITDVDFQDSYLYDLKRQHNLVNTKIVTNNFPALFNLTTSIAKIDHFLRKNKLSFFQTNFYRNELISLVPYLYDEVKKVVVVIITNIIFIINAEECGEAAYAGRDVFSMVQKDSSISPGNSPTSARTSINTNLTRTTYDDMRDRNSNDVVDPGTPLSQIPRTILVDMPVDIANSSLPLIQSSAPFVAGGIASRSGFVQSFSYGVAFQTVNSVFENKGSEGHEQCRADKVELQSQIDDIKHTLKSSEKINSFDYVNYKAVTRTFKGKRVWEEKKEPKY